MSKAVKSVGRAISGVVKGVTNVVKSVASGVSKVFSSKLGKVVLMAAAVYFGGAALMGGIGGATSTAAGTSFLSGAQAGLQSAWAGITSGSISGVASGFTNAFNAGAGGSLASAAGGSALASAAPTVQTASQLGSSFATDMAAAGVKSAPLVNGAASAGMGELAKYGLITGGMQLAGGVISGVGQQKAMEDQRNYETQQAQLARDRYNQNVGTSLWGAAPKDAPAGAPGQTPFTGYDPVAEARALAERRRAEFDAQYPSTGLIARGMQYGQPTTNNNFPIYNPMYYRG